MVRLEIEPYIGGVHGERALGLDDLVDTPGRDANVLGDAVFREAKGTQEILAENLARMDGSVRFHASFNLV